VGKVAGLSVTFWQTSTFLKYSGKERQLLRGLAGDVLHGFELFPDFSAESFPIFGVGKNKVERER
jgi:hypothetical protein